MYNRLLVVSSAVTPCFAKSDFRAYALTPSDNSTDLREKADGKQSRCLNGYIVTVISLDRKHCSPRSQLTQLFEWVHRHVDISMDHKLCRIFGPFTFLYE